jgi:ribonuclease HII
MSLKSFYGEGIEAGIDEVGRGALAGPVVAASVILPRDFKSELIKDSKKLSDKKKKLAFELIKENAIDWSYSFIDPKIIDTFNIQKATFAAMHNSIYKLKNKPELLLVDGNIFESYEGIPHVCVVKGDNEYLSIAAASIVAKVVRDEYMSLLHEKYPQYGWKSNKGYGSKEHRERIKDIGITEHHRHSFLKNILQS